MSLYAVSSITKVSLIDLSKEVIPYVVGILIVLMLCAYVPAFSLTLPALL